MSEKFGADQTDEDTAHRVIRVKMFEMGHSFDTIDNMSIQDYIDVMAVWHGETKAKEKSK